MQVWATNQDELEQATEGPVRLGGSLAARGQRQGRRHVVQHLSLPMRRFLLHLPAIRHILEQQDRQGVARVVLEWQFLLHGARQAAALLNAPVTKFLPR